MHPGLGAPTTGGMTQPGSGIPWSGRPGEHVSVLRGTPYRHEKRGDGWVMQSAAPTIETITGYPPHELLGDNGRSYLSIVHPDDLPLVSEVVTVAVERREPYAVEYRIVHADGSTRWVQGHGQPIQGADGEVRVIDGVLFDVTERRTSEERLAHLALHDPLTDLPNRALFQEHLTVAIANARRSGSGGAVLFIDLDDFKLVNDSFGHAVGDELLVLVARRLRESAGPATWSPARAATSSSSSCRAPPIRRARRGRPGGRREPAHALAKPFAVAGTELVHRRRASARASSPPTATPPRTLLSTPTSPCTPPRTRAATATASTSRRSATRASSSRSPRSCARPSGATSSSSTTSRSSTSRSRASSAPRR